MNYSFVSHTASQDWGHSRVTVESDGQGSIRLYQYNDDLSTVYVCDLHVSEFERRKGVGMALLKNSENYGRAIGAAKIRLWVKKDSWMHNWYLRLGYSFLDDNADLPGNVWLEKELA